MPQIFLRVNSHQVKVGSEATIFSWVWPIECGKVYVLSNQIAGFFYQQKHWKEQFNIFDFLHGYVHQGKVASKTITFGWVGLGVPLFQ